MVKLHRKTNIQSFVINLRPVDEPTQEMDSVLDFVGYCEKIDSAGTSNRLLLEFEAAMAGLGYSNVSFLQLAKDVDDITCADDTIAVAGTSSNHLLELDSSLLHGALNRNGAAVIRVPLEQSRLIHASDPIAGTTPDIEELCVTLRGNGGTVAFVFALKTVEAEASLVVVDGVAAAFYNRFLSLRASNGPDVFLTEKETQTLKMIATGLTKNDIAKEQGVTCHAVDFHYRNILKKYRTKRMLVAVVKAVRGGLV